jgi:hypothetical protein
MILTVISKNKDKHNKVIAYKLKSPGGQSIEVTPQMLKAAILNGKVTLDNMRLTSDHRLIDIKSNNDDLIILNNNLIEKIRMFKNDNGTTNFTYV